MTAADRVRLAHEAAAVITAIWFDIDHGDGSGVSEHFTEGAALSIFGREVRGRQQIDDLYAVRRAGGPRVSRHLMTNLYVIDAGHGTAEVLSSLCLFAEDGEAPRPTAVPAAVCDVVDRLEQHDGRWLIGARQIRMVFVSPDAVFPIPTP